MTGHFRSPWDSGAICLAALRRDGFVSLDAQGQQVSLRFTLRNARFYSYWVA